MHVCVCLCMLFRAVTNQSTLVPYLVCQCGTYEGGTQTLGLVFLRGICHTVSNDNGHVENEGRN